MKDFDYYSKPKAPYFGYEQEQAYQKELLDQINTTPMTAAQREQELKNVYTRLRDHAREYNKSYVEEQTRLDAEFWADCREEMGYDKILTAEGVSALEYEAYERGHSSGYSEIHNCLLSLASFVETIARCIKPKKEN